MIALKFISEIVTNFKMATGFHPCVAFAGLCAVLAGILSIKTQPWRKEKFDEFGLWFEAEPKTKWQEL